MRRTPFAFLAITVVVLTVTVTAQRGGGGGGNPGLPPLGQVASLRGVAPPRPDVSAYVRDPQALVVLGKALFWDTQVGSDGRTACGTCHFHAGADHRVTNTVASPANAATAFRPNATLTAADFPFHAFANPNNNGSPVVRDRRDVVGSAGLAARTFVAVTAGSAVDLGADSGAATPFTIDGTSVRQVTARNAPSVINAVFNVRNFWDGRASSVFTGPTPFGDADGRASVLVDRGGRLEAVRLRVDNASLASQAVGPPLNGVEMSFDGRAWAHLGTKLLALRPLARQQVAGDDSVLGPLADAGGTGLRDVTYASLVQAAFHGIYWASAVVVDADGRPIDGADAPRGDGEFTQAAYNFPLFVGLAIDAYEATLVADDTPVDRFLAGDAGALSAQEQAGLTEFRSAGAQCTQCHQGPEFTAAGVTTARNVLADPRAAGFFRTGVSAIEDDAGAAASDGFGRPLFVGPGAGGTAAGAFKSPGLRNVELTGPYFHTGGASTLEQVMEFYNRDGDVPAGGNLGPGMGQINLNGGERAQLVALMKALTDDRVRFERAPFDHPALCVPVGHVETNGVLQVDSAAGSRSAADRLALVPAVGRNGNDVPLQTFEELLAGVGVDGSRAHTLTQGCTP